MKADNKRDVDFANLPLAKMKSFLQIRVEEINTSCNMFWWLVFQEVMAEVDDDKSSTLDFYEFLKVAVIILKKTGKSLCPLHR